MARALTRERGKRSSVFERERELKRLRLSVCDDTGFRLYVATYDQPKRRDELIARVTREAEAGNVLVTQLDLADAGPDTNLVALLRAHLRKTELPPGWRQAVMVTSIEQRIDYGAGRDGFAFLHQANLLRDALPEAAPAPVVLWLSRLASSALPAEAPDLWDWRAANFDFTGDEAPRVELLRELTTPRYDDRGSSAERRRARVRMLEELFTELEREGPPKSKRRAAERANLLFEIGIENWRLKRAAEAIPLFERALDLYRKADDQRGEAAAVGNLGNTLYRLGEPRRAIERYEQALAIARKIGDRRSQVSSLCNLGDAWAALGEPRRAVDFFEQALEITREISDPQGEIGALGGLGNAYAALGDLRRAIEFYERRLSVAQKIEDNASRAAALDDLDTVWFPLGEPWRAVEHYRQWVSIAREIGYRKGEANALRNLGYAWTDVGDLSQAIRCHEEDLAVRREISDRVGEGNALANVANAWVKLGEPRRAIEYYEQSLAIFGAIGDRWGEGNALFNSALAFDQFGERREAIGRMEKALRIYEQIEHPAKREPG